MVVSEEGGGVGVPEEGGGWGSLKREGGGGPEEGAHLLPSSPLVFWAG